MQHSACSNLRAALAGTTRGPRCRRAATGTQSQSRVERVQETARRGRGGMDDDGLCVRRACAVRHCYGLHTHSRWRGGELVTDSGNVVTDAEREVKVPPDSDARMLLSPKLARQRSDGRLGERHHSPCRPQPLGHDECIARGASAAAARAARTRSCIQRGRSQRSEPARKRECIFSALHPMPKSEMVLRQGRCRAVSPWVSP